MKAEQTTERQKVMIEPFYKRIPSNIIDWFVKKGQSIKRSFLSYIKSKETWKLWRRRLIIVGVIVLILISFKVKSALDLYPYSKEDYLLTDQERTTLTNYNGAKGYDRIATFYENSKTSVDDSIRMVSTVMGYQVTEDLTFDASEGTIELTIDNRKNKMLTKELRVKKTVVYKEMITKISNDAKYQYYLVADGRPDYLIAERDLSDEYGSSD